MIPPTPPLLKDVRSKSRDSLGRSERQQALQKSAHSSLGGVKTVKGLGDLSMQRWLDEGWQRGGAFEVWASSACTKTGKCGKQAIKLMSASSMAGDRPGRGG